MLTIGGKMLKKHLLNTTLVGMFVLATAAGACASEFNIPSGELKNALDFMRAKQAWHFSILGMRFKAYIQLGSKAICRRTTH